jgi:hypothetical protein
MYVIRLKNSVYLYLTQREYPRISTELKKNFHLHTELRGDHRSAIMQIMSFFLSIFRDIMLIFPHPTTAIVTVIVWNVSPCNLASQISETLILLRYIDYI